MRAATFKKQCVLWFGLSLWFCGGLATTGLTQEAPDTPRPAEEPAKEPAEEPAKAEPAKAEPDQAEPAKVESPVEVKPEAAAPRVAEVDLEDPAWVAYREAFGLCADKKLADCQRALKRISSTYQGHPAASLSLRSQEDLQARDERSRGINGERYSALARAELMTFQTFHGLAVGAELCVLTDCREDPQTLAVMLGGGAGMALSWWGSRGGITPGHTLALNSGVGFGVLNAALLTLLLDVDSGSPLTLTLMSGQGIGLGLGHLYYHAVKPTVGQVALTNSGGLWTLASVMLSTAVITNGDLEKNGTLTIALLSANGGLAAGGFLAQRYPMSRSRVTLIDMGGLLGALVGGSVFSLSGGESDRVGITSVLLGSWAGLATTTALTGDWDDDDDDVQRKKKDVIQFSSISLLPTQLGAADARADEPGWTLRLGGQW